MKILKEGTPIKLFGECAACHTIVESDVREARKVLGPVKMAFEVDCPTCQHPINLWPKLLSEGVLYAA